MQDLRRVRDQLVCEAPEWTKEFTEEVLLKVEGELKPQTFVSFLG